jgi:hypothetical protein
MNFFGRSSPPLLFPVVSTEYNHNSSLTWRLFDKINFANKSFFTIGFELVVKPLTRRTTFDFRFYPWKNTASWRLVPPSNPASLKPCSSSAMLLSHASGTPQTPAPPHRPQQATLRTETPPAPRLPGWSAASRIQGRALARATERIIKKGTAPDPAGVHCCGRRIYDVPSFPPLRSVSPAPIPLLLWFQ